MLNHFAQKICGDLLREKLDYLVMFAGILKLLKLQAFIFWNTVVIDRRRRVVKLCNFLQIHAFVVALVPVRFNC